MSTTGTDTATTETAAHERTFWRSDYARFARAIRRTRHVMGDEHTAKSAEHQARCDELAGAVAAVFKTDAPDKFSYSKFTLSTHLPGDETEDEADEYAAQVLGEAAGDDEDEEFGPEDVSYPSGTYPDGTSPDEHNQERPGPLAQGPPGRSAVPGYAGTRPGTVPWYT